LTLPSRWMLLLLLCTSTIPGHGQSAEKLSESFWTWRAQEQPFTPDDIPRIERPSDYRIDWSPQAIELRKKQLADFESQWKSLAPPSDASIHDQVNYRLLGSALARVHWELSINQGWKQNPLFYVDQTLGSILILLLPPPPFDPERQRQLVSRMQSIPATLANAQTNLSDMRGPFAKLAIDGLNNLPDRMQKMETALSPVLTPANQQALEEATPAALKALAAYRSWLEEKLPAARKDTAIGRENYIYFLRNVALVPYTPEQLLAMSQQEWSRAVAFETYRKNRNAGAPSATLFPNAAAQIAAEKLDEEEIRKFLVEQKILTVPAWMKHYRNLKVPAYVEPFQEMGVLDDLTGPSRLDQDGTSYIFEPSPSLGFFYLSTAHDPRPIIVHEGVPGHYFQLSLGWKNADLVRRHYYDSNANEGIGFYAEEMMLQAGLFDENPHTRETIYSFMRLRALRVEVDVKLALGEFTLEQAADYLVRTVPMDPQTGLEEATLFASTPGQAISYQIGKLQIVELLSDARRSEGEKFSLEKFHDFVWENGNVPISLQRWEYLKDGREVPAVMPAPHQEY
jgi:uncharacterized protein (DUF885 family)